MKNEGMVKGHCLIGAATRAVCFGVVATTLLIAPEASAAFSFGAAVAVGDFNQAGGWARDEVVVGAPYDDWGGYGVGSLTVYWRSPSGSSTWVHDWIDQTRLNGGLFTGGEDGGMEEWDHFGEVLAVGDFDHDGYKDLAIGVPWEDIGDQYDAGCVHVLYGAASGPNGMPFRESTVYLTRANAYPYPLAATPTSSDQFGYSLAAGDFDGNGYDDLAIGAPGAAVNGLPGAGAVFVFYSFGVGFQSVDEYTLHHGGPYSTTGVADAYEGFGWALAAGNFNGDLNGTDTDGTGPDGSRRIMDLAVSATGQSVNGTFAAGNVTVYYGRAYINFVTDNNWVIDQSSLETPEWGDSFGFSLAAGDFTSECHPYTNAISCASLRQDDLAIGVPYESLSGLNGAGLVHVLYGTTAGISTSNAQTWNSNNFTTVDYSAPIQAGALFGYSLAVGEFLGEPNGGCGANGCNPLELIIGEPYRDRSSTDSGQGYVLRGGLNQLLRADYSDYPVLLPWTQETYGQFTSSLAIGFVGTERGSTNSGDVVVGAPGTDGAFVHFGDANEPPQSAPPIDLSWPW
jgi:hypothetical protein